MSNKLEFDRTKYEEGEAAFARGLSIAAVVEQTNRFEDSVGEFPKGADHAARDKFYDRQKDTEKATTGFLLGYVNAALQTLRRTESLLSNLRVAAPTGGPRA